MSGNIIVFVLWSCCIILSIITILIKVNKFPAKACHFKLKFPCQKNITNIDIPRINVKSVISYLNVDRK